MQPNFGSCEGEIYPSGILPLVYAPTTAPSILLGIMTITLNIFVIRFYRKTELTVVSLLYTLIASMDIIYAVGSIYQYTTLTICFYSHIGAGKAFDVNAAIFLFLMQVGSRCSVFCNLVLAVSRTIMIAKPFFKISKKAVKVVCIVNAVPLIVLYGINLYAYHSDLTLGTKSYFEAVLNHGFMIGFGLSDILRPFATGHSRSHYKNFIVVMLLLPDFLVFIIPVIIVIITCIIQIRSIWSSSQFPNRANQRHVTITVLFMSTLFVICNSALCGFLALKLIPDLQDFALYKSFLALEANHEGRAVLYGTLLPLVNGAFNPVIIISRSSEMKRKFWNVIQKRRGCVRNRQGRLVWTCG